MAESGLLGSERLPIFKKFGVDVGPEAVSSNPVKAPEVDVFYRAVASLPQLDATTVMTLAEEHLADVAAPQSYGSGLSVYDILRHRVLLGDAEKFLVVYGALSGIQSYLFDVRSSRALKQLRGRSFYLYLLQDAVVERVMREFGVERQSVLYSTGGTFCMMLPYQDGIEERFQSLADNITSTVFGAHRENIILLNSKVATLADIENNLSALFSDIHSRKNRDKHTPLCGKMQDMYSQLFTPQPYGNNAKSDEQAEELGALLGRIKYIVVGSEKVCGALLTIEPGGLGVKYQLLDSDGLMQLKDVAATSSLIVYNDTKLPNVPIRCRREYLAGVGVATRSFADLLNNSTSGMQRLGVLRMDVDNLGTTLRKCYDHKPALAYYAGISRRLDKFFKERLNAMWREKYKDSVVIVYSGGDDLFIVGEWANVFDFAVEINRQHKSFFGQSDITISGGMSFVDESFPIIRAAEYSADEESNSKNFAYTDANGVSHQKNALSIFGTALRWDVELSVVCDIYKQLAPLMMAKEKIYRPIIRRLLKYFEIVRFENKQITPLRQVWLMTYDLERAIKRIGGGATADDKAFISQCKNDIITGVTMMGRSLDTPYHSLQLWAIAARLVELKTRNNNI